MIDIPFLYFSDCSPKQSPHNPLTSYASYLKKMYTSMSQRHTSHHWAHLPRCEFIQLAMIKDEQIRRGGPEEEMTRLAQQGKIETILRHKESIDLDDLFPLPPRSPQPLVVLPPPGRVCLIEGPPGGGKSTFALHICHQWAQGASWLANFDLVILAYLRDETIQNASSLADILPARNTEMSQSTASQLQANDGTNVLFVFDGWDEFPPNKMKSSLISTILRQPHKLSLHQSTVLITSRPVATGNLLHIADRRVEILGFTHKQIREFIEKALDGNRTQIQQLVQHLEEHPVIEGYCYIPLHSAILVHIFLTMKGALPTTHHELFCDLVLCCIVREQETHEPDTILPVMSSLNDLPDDLKSKLNNLCLIAYNGVVQGKIIFYLEDLLTSDINLPSLGLLQATQGLTLCSKSISYNFLHLSVQELLAAYHISQMDSSEQIRVFKKMFGSPRFQAVLQYYCGFTKLDNPEIQQFISSYHGSKFGLKEFLPILHCFFEAKQPSLTQLIDPMRFMSYFYLLRYYDMFLIILELTPVDLLAVGYFIVSFLFSCEQESNTTILYLSTEQHLDDRCLRLLLNELSKNPFDGAVPTSAGALSEKFVWRLSKPSLTGLKYIASYLKRFPLIRELTLTCIDTWSDVHDFVTEMLHTKIMTKLSIKGSIFMNKFSAMIKIKCAYFKPLTELDLSSDSEVELCNIITHLQHYSTNLVKLNLSKCNINQYTARLLSTMLRENNSLTHLNLSGNYYDFSDSGAKCMLFESLNRFISLIFSALEHNTTLLHLVFHEIGISKDGAEVIAKTLKSNQSLQTIDISHPTISRVDIILSALKFNTTLKKMRVTYNWAADVAVGDLQKARKERGLPPIDIEFHRF